MKIVLLSGLLLAGTAARADDSPDLGAAMAMENPEGGGSIRAKREPDMAAQQRKADRRNLQARVIAIKRGTFPDCALLLKVSKIADDGPGKDQVKKDDEVIVVPAFKKNGKSVDWSDAASVQNAGAFYLSEGDSVYARIESQSGKSWKAGYLERR